MNAQHEQLCSSPEWAAHLQTTVLPAVTSGIVLGEELLELGPGFGAATDWLRRRVRRLVAVEHDERRTNALRERFAGSNVEVAHGDATALGFAPGSFDSVAALTMLHHIPTRALQARLLSEAARVLRPGGVLFGSDSLHSDELHHFHRADTYNPVEPGLFLTWLEIHGYVRITVRVDRELTFAAHKPLINPQDPPDKE